MRRFLLLALLVALVAVSVAACGSSNSTPPPTPPPVSSPLHQDGVVAAQCRHYRYVYGPDGRRHRQPCSHPAPVPGPPTPAPVPSPPGPAPAPSPPPAGASYGPAPGPVVLGPPCGTERWATKTLQDPAAGDVNTTPQVTTIADLGSKIGASPAPVKYGDRTNAEKQVYELRDVKLQLVKTEADGDLHLVLAGGGIVEFPTPACVTGAAPAAQQAINAARTNFEQACGTTQGSTPLSGTATIDGVGFEDFAHGQTGGDLLANGADLELHPAVRFHLTSPSC